MTTHKIGTDSGWPFFRFGLIVTGKGEREHLQKLFSPIMSTGTCTFEVFQFVDQLSPLPKRRIIKMVGEGKIIPDDDSLKIGARAREYIRQGEYYFVILIDDLEQDRRHIAQQVFERYRLALDAMLLEHKNKASVHFLVNMLEAYYFSDAEAINVVLGLDGVFQDHQGDVETIVHPKQDIKDRANFREKDDGGAILDRIDTEKVLSNPETCGSLRTLFKWCIKILERHPYFHTLNLENKFCLQDGILSEITRHQIDQIEQP